MVHLGKEHYPKGIDRTLNMRKIIPCRVKRMFGDSAYEVKLRK